MGQRVLDVPCEPCIRRPASCPATSAGPNYDSLDCPTRCIWARLYNVVRVEMQSIRLSDILQGDVMKKFNFEVDSLLSTAG